jgi:hypothetical protein
MLSSARARLDSQRPVGAAGAGGLREPVEGLARAGRLSALLNEVVPVLRIANDFGTRPRSGHG